MFARTMRGVWACTNPECDERHGERSEQGVGRLFGIPTSSCDCGARVLELLYCFECGDVSFGGFVIRDLDGTLLLTPTPVEIPAASTDFVFRRPHGAYAWYRPGSIAIGDKWSHKSPAGSAVDLAFIGAHWDPLMGALTANAKPSTGVMLTVRGLPDDGSFRVPALPERCPRCWMRTGRAEARKFFRGIVRSPIRAHTAGLAAATQLLLSRLTRSMGAASNDSRTIVFTDSRDDAARTAVGVERNHFRDLVRQLLRQELQAHAVDRVGILRRGAVDESNLEGTELRVFEELRRSDPSLVLAYARAALGGATEADATRIAAFESTEASGGVRRGWASVLQQTMSDLVALGVNPAGPKASMNHLSVDRGLPWYRVHQPPTPGLWTTLSPDVSSQDLARHRESLAGELATAIFDRAGRDIESIGLAWVDAEFAIPWPSPMGRHARRSERHHPNPW